MCIRDSTYSVPQKFKSQIDIGSRVTAPLGKRSTTGIIIGFPKKPVFTGTIKNIASLVDPYPVLDKTLWKLVHWMSTYYFTPMGQVAKTVLPAQLSMKHLPQKILNEVINILKTKINEKPGFYLQNSLENCLKHLTQTGFHANIDLVRYNIEKLDKRRNLDSKKIFPKLYEEVLK